MCGCDACDGQPLVRFDAGVLVVLALVRAQFELPAGANRNSEIVLLVRFQNRAGRLRVSAVAAATVKATSRAGDRSLATVGFIRASLKTRCRSFAAKLSRQEPSYSIERRAGKFGAGRLGAGQIRVRQIGAREICVRKIRS